MLIGAAIAPATATALGPPAPTNVCNQLLNGDSHRAEQFTRIGVK